MQTSQNDERRTTTGGIREFGTIQRGEAHGPCRREGGRETERPAAESLVEPLEVVLEMRAYQSMLGAVSGVP